MELGTKAAPKLLEKLGAKVFSIGVKPNGLNINDRCGSTYPSKICSAVKKLNAHVGISFDGDMIELSCVMKMVK